MLEWMHDSDVTDNMQADFASKTLDDCLKFIKDAQQSKDNLHFAIVNDYDEYMGTVSLKNIEKNRAEFAITIRKCAMGRDFSKFGMETILKMGLENLGLEYIYWYVDKNNQRALRFYDKNGYIRVNPEVLHGMEEHVNKQNKFVWYQINSGK